MGIYKVKAIKTTFVIRSIINGGYWDNEKGWFHTSTDYGVSPYLLATHYDNRNQALYDIEKASKESACEIIQIFYK